MNMNKKRRCVLVLCLALVMVMSFSLSAAAASKSIKCEVYRGVPATVTLAEREESQISRVARYSFTFRGRRTFESISSFLNALSGANLTPKGVKWVSSDEGTATVSSSGKITAVKKGTAYVYPVPKNAYFYREKKRFIVYDGGNILSGVKIRFGIGVKVKVTSSK